MRQMPWRGVWRVKIDDMKSLASAQTSALTVSETQVPRGYYEASTTSLPQGEIDAEPTGLSKVNETS